MRPKSEFLGRMSHELRTPLHSVMGFTNVLLRNKHLSLESRDLNYLQRIRFNGLHLLNLINDLLDLARIEEGGLAIETKELDVASLIRETVDPARDWGVKGHVTVRTDMPPKPRRIRADESRLRQVLIRLVGNAVKFTKEGSITVVPGRSRFDSARDTGGRYRRGHPLGALVHHLRLFRSG